MADVLVAGSMVLPIAPPDSSWGRMAIKRNADFQEEIGWPELVATVANIRDSLPTQNQAQVGILAGNYGEAGAINLYGPRYGLPEAISGMNSFWLRGYGNPPPQILIVVGVSREFAKRNFAMCALMGHTGNMYNVENEETRSHPDIFVCGAPLGVGRSSGEPFGISGKTLLEERSPNYGESSAVAESLECGRRCYPYTQLQ